MIKTRIVRIPLDLDELLKRNHIKKQKILGFQISKVKATEIFVKDYYKMKEHAKIADHKGFFVDFGKKRKEKQ